MSLDYLEGNPDSDISVDEVLKSNSELQTTISNIMSIYYDYYDYHR